MENTPKRDRREYMREYRLKKKTKQKTLADISSAIDRVSSKTEMVSGEVGASMQSIIEDAVTIAIAAALEPFLKEIRAFTGIPASPIEFTPPPFTKYGSLDS